MRPPKNQWSSTPQAKMALFIAQCMQEMLGEGAFESFRLPTLESLSRLREVGAIANLIENRRVPTAAIRSAIAELKSSISNDPILLALDEPLVEQFLKELNITQTISQRDVRNILNLSHVFYGRIASSYRERLESEFITLIDNPAKKVFALKVIQSYLSLLVNEGFDRSYILSEVESRFFTEPVSKVGRRSFSRFVQTFKHSEKSYKIWLPVSQQVYNYVKIMSPKSVEVKKYSDVPIEISKTLDGRFGQDEYPAFILAKVDKADPYSALDLTQEILSAMASLTFFIRRALSLNGQVRHTLILPARRPARLLNQRDLPSNDRRLP